VTAVEVDCGICGHHALVEVSREPRTHVRVSVQTDCEMLSSAVEQVDGADWREALSPRNPNSVHAVMFQVIKHAGCPAPAAVAKAIEVEVGVALPRDVSICFQPRRE
jgi:hypothetical protein